ncbi:TonB-dependent receptor domain-containing protein [Pusillimonas sp.]|uniref:TonB-dependent receptor domain-containing protein n=1 Tax=Pusillimonas sp. TaxID=3040095 RepID=UPI0039B9BA0E
MSKLSHPATRRVATRAPLPPAQHRAETPRYIAAAFLLASAPALAQGVQHGTAPGPEAASSPETASPTSAQGETVTLEAITVSAAMMEQDLFDAAASVDRVEGEWLRAATMQVDLSERLDRVPGLLIRDRQNYAQDLQLSIRGFGARSSFGVRGVRLYVDGIPATMPDGQGQTSNIDIASVDHIEILRGPFSALHGNSSGGVVQVYTEKGEAPPSLAADFAAGSHGQRRYGLKASGARGEGAGAVDYVLSTHRYETDGFREHSAARKYMANARLGLQLNERDRVTLIANSVDLRADDPQGLQYDEAMDTPRKAAPNALLYDTRKTVRQTQVGLLYEARMDADNDLRLMAYYGQRDTVQFQGIPVESQLAPTHAGGVIDLERKYTGLDLRWTSRLSLAGRPLALTAGIAYDTLTEARRGYENFSDGQLGVKGALRRDETNTLRNVDPYLQASWELTDRWTLEGGARYSDIRFRSDDHYVDAANGDDGGAVRYRRLLPVAALRFRALQDLNLYVTAGRGFETPTFNEVSYRPGGAPGLNLALAPSTNTSMEAGAKARLGDSLITAALFQTRTQDEIVTAESEGGRGSYRNAGRTRRDGFELSWSGRWKQHGRWVLSYAWLNAKYQDDVPAANAGDDGITAGNRIPGIARHAAFASLDWAPPTGWRGGVEGRYLGRVYADDANTATAPGYFTASAYAGHAWQLQAWRIEAFARIDNLFDRRYIGSTIVNAGFGRYYEPAPGRNWTAGVSVTHEF